MEVFPLRETYSIVLCINILQDTWGSARMEMLAEGGRKSATVVDGSLKIHQIFLGGDFLLIHFYVLQRRFARLHRVIRFDGQMDYYCIFSCICVENDMSIKPSRRFHRI